MPTGYLRRLKARVLGVKVSADSGEVSLDAGAITRWQFDHHKGFVYSFIHTALHGPAMNQHANWKKLCTLSEVLLSEHPLRFNAVGFLEAKFWSFSATRMG